MLSQHEQLKHIYMHAWAHRHTGTHTHTHIHACMGTEAHANTHAQVHACTHITYDKDIIQPITSHQSKIHMWHMNFVPDKLQRKLACSDDVTGHTKRW